jgi:penicillin amidase
MRRALPYRDGMYAVTGLEGDVAVDCDQWGVPHISSGHLEDVLFAQGFVTAQDRMVQMELFRRIASGRLAEVMGKAALSIDIFQRDLGIYRTAECILKVVPSDTLVYLERYSAGVNAYLEERASSLPMDLLFMAQGRPEPWRPVDALATELLFTWLFDATWTADLMRGRLIRKLGKADAQWLLPASGPGNVPVLEYDEPASRPPTIDPPPECEIDFLQAMVPSAPWLVKKVSLYAQGSNNWVISGERTVSGKPLLCNDPHAQHTVPTLFYLCHMKSNEPHCNVIGAALPGIPGMVVGRNEALAWGSTSMSPDTVDVFIETFENDDSNRYLANGGVMEAEVIEEEIKILPGRKYRHQVVITRHGPVIARRGDKGLALKWVGHDADNDSAGCLVRMGLATNWEEFTRSLKGYSGPAVNLVYADVEGNIGYYAAARLPKRKGNDGSVPLPGHIDDYDWDGYVTIQDMPNVLNPDRKWIATANNQVVTGDCPHLITTMWESSNRQARIAELLGSSDKHSLEGMCEIQGDIVDNHGAIFRGEILEAAKEREGLSQRTEKALVILAGWDGRAGKDSVGQTIYYFSWKVMTERLLRHRLGHSLYFEYTTSFSNVSQAVERLLRERREEWLPPSAQSFQELLIQCLDEAILRIETRFRTEDMSQWRWGRMHSLEIRHFLGSIWPLRRLLNLGPVSRGGDSETVCSAMPESEPTVQVLARSAMGGSAELPFLPQPGSDRDYAGSVYRMIVDLSDIDASLWCLDVGQCSNPTSPYYRNFFSLWQGMGYVPMVFSDKKVNELSKHRLILKPK